MPAALVARYPDWVWSVAYQYGPEVITYRLDRSPDACFLKLALLGGYPSLESETERMRWAANHLRVPRIVEFDSNAEVAWLLTEGLPGRDATHAIWSDEPERLVSVLAGGLREFHEAPVADCPFDFRLDHAIGHIKQRVAAGQVEPARDFHEEFGHLSASSALALLEDTRPRVESLVVCHGDYCLPNVLVDDWSPVGFVDLGELGVADRWWDLAVATWSVTWNLGTGYEDLFLAEYGIERDDERTDFYRLLYDLVS